MAGVEIIAIYVMKLGEHVTGLSIQEKWNTAGMMIGVTHEDAYPRSIRPLIVVLLSLKLLFQDVLSLKIIFQDVYWQTKWMEVIEICLHFRYRQLVGPRTIIFIRYLVPTLLSAIDKPSGQVVIEFHIVLQRGGPQRWACGFRPLMSDMKQ